MFLEVVERLTGQLMDQAHSAVPLQQLRAGSTQQGNVYAIVIRIAMVQHNDRAPTRTKHSMNFSDCFCSIGRVMQNTMRIDQIKALIIKVEFLSVCCLKLAWQIEQLEPSAR